MREFGILLFGVFLGVVLQRMAGDSVDKLILKSSAASQAFQEADANQELEVTNE